MFVFVDEDDVQITAVTQLFAAQFTVADDGYLRHIFCVGDVLVFETLPAPLHGDTQYGVG